MLLRWPKKVKPGRIINTAYSSVDFAPTILNMMGIDTDKYGLHGIDGSGEILAPINEDNEYTKSQTRFITDSAQQKWATAVRDDYKLTLSNGEPWLFDLSKDPNELENFYSYPKYKDIVEEMQEELYEAMFLHQFPLGNADVVYFSRPSCYDSRNQISSWKKRLCKELVDPNYSPGCQWRPIYEQCPVACNRCCEDSPGKLLISESLLSCGEEIVTFCENAKVRTFCPRSCNICPGQSRETPINPEDEDEDDNSSLGNPNGNDDEYVL